MLKWFELIQCASRETNAGRHFQRFSSISSEFSAVRKIHTFFNNFYEFSFLANTLLDPSDSPLMDFIGIFIDGKIRVPAL